MISCDLASDLKSYEQMVVPNGRSQKNKKIRMTTELIAT